jgi:hypothetical protein
MPGWSGNDAGTGNGRIGAIPDAAWIGRVPVVEPLFSNDSSNVSRTVRRMASLLPG